jgi:hypothetical protein
LSEIFTNTLQDLSLDNTYLIVDALNKCATGLVELLKLIIKTSSAPYQVKWTVLGRILPNIGSDLDVIIERIRRSLKLDKQPISSTIIIQFIQG